MSKDLVDQNKNHEGVFSQPGIEPTISSSKFQEFFCWNLSAEISKN